MSNRRLSLYIGIMCAGAVVGAVLTDWSVLSSMPASGIGGLVGLIAVGVLSEALAIGIAVGGTAHTSSITFLPLLAGVQLFGPAAAITLILITQVFGEFVVRRKSLEKGLFNVAQAVLATSIAGWAFGVLGGVPLETAESPNLARQIWPFISFGLLFLGLNHAAVSLAITISQGQSFRRVWRRALDNTAGLNDILISPVALAIAFLYVSFGIAGIVVILLPMLFIRYSYLTTSKLKESNADLLTALVKAIEIRDPYTSGHSVRVSGLAQKIAEALSLNAAAVDQTTDAALLHDIGKIEEIYTEILRKPDSLTPRERAVIESHVTRGEQLLRDLSSVPEEVVKIVRHHHEREDGQGYPDGLLGDEIPIGSKIIIVSDAVDAMLSDRPYRDALPLSVVLEQLQEHAGRQFDHRIVKVLTETPILTEFAEAVRVARERQAAERSSGVAWRVPSMQVPASRQSPSSTRLVSLDL
jgi:putative nucleotidyltransferase with HDIG domain